MCNPSTGIDQIPRLRFITKVTFTYSFTVPICLTQINSSQFNSINSTPPNSITQLFSSQLIWQPTRSTHHWSNGPIFPLVKKVQTVSLDKKSPRHCKQEHSQKNSVSVVRWSDYFYPNICPVLHPLSDSFCVYSSPVIVTLSSYRFFWSL